MAGLRENRAAFQIGPAENFGDMCCSLTGTCVMLRHFPSGSNTRPGVIAISGLDKHLRMV